VSATQSDAEAKKAKAAEQLKQQERQRILGVIPEFNVTNVPDAVALSPKQKFELAFTGAVDPFPIGFAALRGGISQWEDEHHAYGQGMQGYFKRFGASYADAFDGAMLGNALFPVLLHEDPRYFRKGTGSIKSRLWYAISSAYRCKSDNGRWVGNYGNLLGNIGAGAISNLYYPPADRGTALIFENAFVDTAQGSLGALAFEFWPDIERHYLRKHQKNRK
jgi:hypothetical protein